ncbi:MAG TPA: hypothetical protein VGS19_03565 [Streptosporangiaceae bacterium]|nr:hypothetical protein [Streptosporangiaceae bacterium]
MTSAALLGLPLELADFLARHQAGDVIDGVVTKQAPFGSSVESGGFTSLAPQQSWHARVSAQILAIDSANQRFSLAEPVGCMLNHEVKNKYLGKVRERKGE